MIFFFFVCISMSWFALHLHYGRAMVSREGHSTPPALFYVFASQKTYWYKRKCPDCRGAIGTKEYYSRNVHTFNALILLQVANT